MARASDGADLGGHCPRCGAEYRSGFDTCSDCGVWLEPGPRPAPEGPPDMTDDQYRSALEGWGAPSTNHIVADTDGHIAWTAAATIPVRREWDGLMPVPGDGRYEWAGFRNMDELPREQDPDRGIGWAGLECGFYLLSLISLHAAIDQFKATLLGISMTR